MENCKICGYNNLNIFTIREMMFGFMDSFKYFECQKCRCIQLGEIPINMEKYYPSNYYSFNDPNIVNDNKVKRFFKKKRDNSAIFGKNFLGKILAYFYPSLPGLSILKYVSIQYNSKILDVGCGNGELLGALNNCGFQNLYGIDPYLSDTFISPISLNISKSNLSDLNTSFDFILLNHSFEHMSNPIAIFEDIKRLLGAKGRCIIRIPKVPSYAWEKYRENWVQLDAPRHYFIHSHSSIEFVASKVGLKLVDVIDDSTEFQFIGSEMYQKNIYLDNNYSKHANKENTHKFRRQANGLNELGFGDSAAFIIAHL